MGQPALRDRHFKGTLTEKMRFECVLSKIRTYLVVSEKPHSGSLVVLVVGDAEVVRSGGEDGVFRFLRRQVGPSRLHGCLQASK